MLEACNFIKKKLPHRCFSVKFVKFLKTPILKNICERLLLNEGDDEWRWLVFVVWLTDERSLKPYFQPRQTSEILTTANLQHALSRIWTCVEVELGSVEWGFAVVITAFHKYEQNFVFCLQNVFTYCLYSLKSRCILVKTSI